MIRITGIMAAVTNIKRGVRIMTVTSNARRGVGKEIRTTTVLIRTHPRQSMAIVIGNDTSTFPRMVKGWLIPATQIYTGRAIPRAIIVTGRPATGRRVISRFNCCKANHH